MVLFLHRLGSFVRQNPTVVTGLVTHVYGINRRSKQCFKAIGLSSVKPLYFVSTELLGRSTSPVSQNIVKGTPMAKTLRLLVQQMSLYLL